MCERSTRSVGTEGLDGHARWESRMRNPPAPGFNAQQVHEIVMYDARCLGGVAQLVRVSACQAECRGFESLRLRSTFPRRIARVVMGRLAKPLPGSNQREFDPSILRAKAKGACTMWPRYVSVCLPCRYTTKGSSAICPQCQRVMPNFGRDFKAPRRSSNAQWQKLALMNDLGVARFRHCGCGPCSLRPSKKLLRTVSDVKSRYGVRRKAGGRSSVMRASGR